jgi:ABC-type antimicrobial peptide transport system permease subunit
LREGDVGHIKDAVRQLNRRPGVSVVIIAILAIGIGVTTGIYSMFHQVLIRPLPVPEPEELVNLAAPPALSYPMFRDLEAQQTVFSGLAAGVEIPLTLSYGDGAPRSGTAVAVSGEYFEVLRLQPALGRLIGSQDEPGLDELRVAVLSYDHWQGALGGDPDVIGRILTVNGQALTIVGVAPARFTGTTFGVRPQVFVPLTLWFLLSDTPRGMAQSRTAFAITGTFGRLQPDTGIEPASVAINSLHSAIIEEFEPNSSAGPGMQYRTIVLESGAKGQRARVAGPFAQPLTLLLAVTLLVLLVVCSNIANLLLARGTARGHEMAIRMAIGAGRGRLVSQVLTEASLLAFIGGVASLVSCHTYSVV